MELIFIIICVIIIIICLRAKVNKSEEQDKAKEEKREQGEKRLFARRIQSWRGRLAEMKEKYGDYDYIAFAYSKELISDFSITNDIAIIFYNNSRTLVITKTFPNAKVLAEIPYSEIIDIDIEVKELGGTSIQTTTSTSLKNVATRTVVGDLLFGPAGAIVGGTTACRTSNSIVNKPKVSYLLYIQLQSMEMPIIDLNFHSDISEWRKTASVFQGIFNQSAKANEIKIYTSKNDDLTENLKSIALGQGNLTHFDVRGFCDGDAFLGEMKFSAFMFKNTLGVDENGELYANL